MGGKLGGIGTIQWVALCWCFFLFSPVFAIESQIAQKKSLSFYVLGTEVSGEIQFFDGRNYSSKELRRASALLRDDPDDESGQMDPRLFDFLYDIKVELQKRQPSEKIVFHIISGYRSPAYNESLRLDPTNPYRYSVSKNSFHTKGMALDILVPGFTAEELRDIAWCLKQGGIGYYPEHVKQSGLEYIHIDVGRVRFWGSDFNFRTIICED